jgi:hypothetical protein
MGTATLWKIIMLAWSYENNLAIPAKDERRAITGGLSRLLSVGYSKNIVKFDFPSYRKKGINTAIKKFLPFHLEFFLKVRLRQKAGYD